MHVWVQRLVLTTLSIMVHVRDCAGFVRNVAAEGKTCMYHKARGRQGEAHTRAAPTWWLLLRGADCAAMMLLLHNTGPRHVTSTCNSPHKP